jgi:outer membrane receptor for ferrienterochelin and colicin
VGNGWENRDPQSAVLPAVSAGTSIFDKRLDFQVAWSQTVARPTFWEFIPSQTIDQSSGLGRRGNNNLSQTEIDNFDLSMTWRPSDATSIRASVFHKNLLRPLVTFYENGILLYADSFLDQLSNSQRDFTGTINGLELEAEISDVGPFSIKGNFTYIDAQLNYFYVQNGQTTSVTSKLPYQPSYLTNINLGYEYEPWKFNANFVYNYNGDYPVILKLTPEDFEVTRQAIHTFDLVLSKVIDTQHVDYTVKAGVKNIFNAVDTYTFRDETYNSDTTGRSFWAEIQMSF